ncbi:hypothetical protein H2204_004866 [Knufia peltigerae]|uniref:O-methyltransferase n=1 Tax=Knufia peltigerae TaxID=1002370 RepID=A0AA39D0J3_9EURO|nr:hypothetical protein H2204_004866 [Knufia peltigerae]
MPADKIEKLRTLQGFLHRQIDDYEAAVSTHPSGERRKWAILENEIFNTSEKIADLMLTPGDRVLRLGLAPMLNTALQVSMQLDLFNIIRGETDLHTLSEKTGATPTLLIRILRCLAAFRILGQSGRGTFSPTPLSIKFRESQARDWVMSAFNVMQAQSRMVPSILESNGYRSPTDRADNSGVRLWGKTMFEMMGEDEGLRTQFGSAMAAQEDLPAQMYPEFPFQRYVVENDERGRSIKEDDAVTIVDVGGGMGHVLELILQRNPGLPGRFVVQDVEEIVSLADPNEKAFEVMAHDFFTPQPIKGARFYYTRHCLHDWTDDQCVTILKHLRDACKPGYSRILIHEFVLPATGCGQREALFDVLMMSLCGMERDEEQWHDILTEAGLEMIKIWRADVGGYAIIEAAPAP